MSLNPTKFKKFAELISCYFHGKNDAFILKENELLYSVTSPFPQYLYTLSQEQIDYCVEKIPFLPIHSPLQGRYVDLMQSIIGKTSSNIITKDFKRKHRAIMWFARVDR